MDEQTMSPDNQSPDRPARKQKAKPMPSNTTASKYEGHTEGLEDELEDVIIAEIWNERDALLKQRDELQAEVGELKERISKHVAHSANLGDACGRMETQRNELAEALRALLEYTDHGTPIHPGAIVLCEAKAALAKEMADAFHAKAQVVIGSLKNCQNCDVAELARDICEGCNDSGNCEDCTMLQLRDALDKLVT